MVSSGKFTPGGKTGNVGGGDESGEWRKEVNLARSFAIPRRSCKEEWRRGRK